jgi:hypothetical protein
LVGSSIKKRGYTQTRKPKKKNYPNGGNKKRC